MIDLFKFVNDWDNYDDRCVKKEKVLDWDLSTAYTSDCGYETAIQDNDKNFRPVERYKNEKDAKAGHRKWKKVILNGKRIFTCIAWEIDGGITKDEEFTLLEYEEKETDSSD